MTRKEQNKILDDKIESNVKQYKVDRLNAEISAFLSGDLNKYAFLTRKDLKYKSNALDKARFEFSPLGKTFSTGLDKTAPGYQEEGVIKVLKDIRDGLAGGVSRLDDDGDDRPDRPDRPDDRPYRPNNNDDNNDNNNNNNNDNNDKISEYQEVKSDGEYYARLIAYQNTAIEKLKKELTDRKKFS